MCHKDLQSSCATQPPPQPWQRGRKCQTLFLQEENTCPLKQTPGREQQQGFSSCSRAHIPFPSQEFQLLSGSSTDNYKPKMGTGTCQRFVQFPCSRKKLHSSFLQAGSRLTGRSCWLELHCREGEAGRRRGSVPLTNFTLIAKISCCSNPAQGM